MFNNFPFPEDEEDTLSEALGGGLQPPPIQHTPSFLQTQEASQQPAPLTRAPILHTPSFLPQDSEENQPIMHTPSFLGNQSLEPGARRADDIRSSVADMTAIRNYMVNRFGAHMRDEEDSRLYDRFVNHMRFFNVNEVTTIGELRWLRGLEPEQQAAAGEAYKIFDSLGNVFTNDGVMGAVDGVADYTRAVLTSPSTYLGGVLGRLVAGGATRTAIQATRQEAIQAAMREATRGLTGRAASQAASAAASRTISQLSRTTAFNQIGIAALFDAGANSFQDYLYQTTLLESGAQLDYNELQTAIAATGGILGGAVAAVPYMIRGAGSDAATRIRVATERRQAEAEEAFAPHIERAIQRFENGMEEWLQSVSRGQALSGDSIKLQEQAVRMLLDPEQPTSIPYAMNEAGLMLRTGADADGAVAQMVAWGRRLPVERLAELDRSFKEKIGVGYTEILDIVAAAESRAGTVLGIGSKAAQAIARVNATRAKVDASIVENIPDLGSRLLSKSEEANLPPERSTIQYIQSLWRRALVSHPATTALNVQGWGQAFAARALAETLHGGVLGTAGLVAKLAAPVSGRAASFSDAALRQSQILFQAQAYKLQNFLAPYETRETFEALLDKMPKYLQQRLDKESFGGVSMETAAKFGMNTESRAIRTLEGMSHKAAAWSGVKVQDVYTKAFSMMGELDRLLKEKMGANLESVINSGRINQVPDEIWERAVEVALRDAFSADFTKTKGIFGGFSKFIEQLSNTPYLGFLFPFGRFLNNNLAFIMQYSPLGMMHFVFGANTRGFFKGATLMESFTKATVGTSALAALAMYQRQKTERGQQWYEEETFAGERVNRQNLAPGSVYLLAGHIADLTMRGEAVSRDLINDLIAQVGLDRITRDLGSNNTLDEAIGYMTSIFDEEQPRQEFAGIMTAMATVAFGDIGSGFTRPLEPLNVAVGALRGDQGIIDRRQLRGPEQAYRGFTRYLDNVFNVFLGERDLPERQDISRLEAVSDPNPVARMFGDRFSPPSTDIDLLLARANIAPWTANERTGIPEWDAVMNEMVTPILNARARELMDTPIYQQANQRTRERLTRTLLREVKREVREAISTHGTPNQILRHAQSRFLSLPESLRIQAKAAFDWQQIDDRDLNMHQLETLRIWVDMQREFEQWLARR